MIDISVIALVATGVLSAFSAGFKAMGLATAKTAAVALANEKMEDIHNMPYDNLGTKVVSGHTGGTVQGDIPSWEETVRRGNRFGVHTVISWVDDPYDGNAEGTVAGKPKDLFPYDYKKIEISVSKIGRNGYLSRLTTNIAAKAAETPSDTGIIKLCVIDSIGIPVSGATLTIENSEVSPPYFMSADSADDGCIMVPKLPPDEQNHYHLTATKDGYSTDITYPRTSQNPNEQHQDVNVSEQKVTDKTLVIDKLSTMEINFVDAAGSPLSNVNFHLESSYEIYFNPTTFKYSQDLTGDAAGYLKLENMEFGDYKLTVNGGIIATTSPYQPIGLKAGTDLHVKVTMAGSSTQPIILSSIPLTGLVNEAVSITVTGDRFDSAAGIKLVNASAQEVVGISVNVDNGETIAADFDMQNVTVGLFDIVITNPNGESVRQVNGFELKQ